MPRVTLQSRLPAVAAELRPRVASKVKEAAEVIAEDAQDRVAIGPPHEHIYDSIEVERAEAAGYRVAVNVADPKGRPYPFAVEFGSSHAPAYPFLIPAMEANADNAVFLVTAALRGL